MQQTVLFMPVYYESLPLYLFTIRERKSESIFAAALPGESVATWAYLLPITSNQTFSTLSDQPFIMSFLCEVSTSSITGSHLPCSCSRPLYCAGICSCGCRGPAAIFHLVTLPLPLGLLGGAWVWLKGSKGHLPYEPWHQHPFNVGSMNLPVL